MATTQTLSEPGTAIPSSTAVLVNLPSMPQEALHLLLGNLEQALPGTEVLAASPDLAPDASESGPGEAGNVRLIGYAPTTRSRLDWTATAADYLNSYELLQRYSAKVVLQVGLEAQTTSPQALRALVLAVLEGGADLAMPHYELPARSGLVNSSILYPVTRALFGSRVRFPLAPDLCLSPRMAERLATAAQRFTAQNQPDALVWPVSEAVAGAVTAVDVAAGARTFAQPATPDLNALLAQVTASMFTDMEAKAATWQRVRVASGTVRSGVLTAPPASELGHALDEVQPMLDSFRLAYGNLREIWSLVLPPQTLLGLKRLSELTPANFRMPDTLWARIVYDFFLAFRLRTINRGHLLGALTPLYLAWVASHILLTAGTTDAERHVEAQAEAFEADKPYLVSRWRWPDRFNP
jgi:hypothetical protein